MARLALIVLVLLSYQTSQVESLIAARTPAPAGITVLPAKGVHSDLQPDSPLPTRRREIALMRDAGVRWVRLALNWYRCEPRRGQLDERWLQDMEILVDEIRAADIQIMMLLLATPPWANPAGWDAPPLQMRDFGVFAGRAVRRFASRVKYWEIWNEPDWHLFWKPSPDPGAFVDMLREAYTAGKAADPEATFVSGGLAGNNVEYLRQMYAMGAGRYLDAVGVHPYVFRRSPDETHPDARHSFHGLADIRRIMMLNGDAGKPIIITEMSWPTHQRASGAIGDWAEGVSLETQAAYLVRAYQKIRDEYSFIPMVIWYNLRDNGPDRTVPEHNFGLVRHDFRPKPAYQAFTRLHR